MLPPHQNTVICEVCILCIFQILLTMATTRKRSQTCWYLINTMKAFYAIHLLCVCIYLRVDPLCAHICMCVCVSHACYSRVWMGGKQVMGGLKTEFPTLLPDSLVSRPFLRSSSTVPAWWHTTSSRARNWYDSRIPLKLPGSPADQ